MGVILATVYGDRDNLRFLDSQTGEVVFKIRRLVSSAQFQNAYRLTGAIHVEGKLIKTRDLSRCIRNAGSRVRGFGPDSKMRSGLRAVVQTKNGFDGLANVFGNFNSTDTGAVVLSLVPILLQLDPEGQRHIGRRPFKFHGATCHGNLAHGQAVLAGESPDLLDCRRIGAAFRRKLFPGHNRPSWTRYLYGRFRLQNNRDFDNFVIR